jgi:NAD(P)-dependent dehydrogenase (short-subunit alcohol dehydrogenase family)
VVTIAPGTMETPMLAGLPQEARTVLEQQVPHPARLGRPDEYAALVEHIVANQLCSTARSSASTAPCDAAPLSNP